MCLFMGIICHCITSLLTQKLQVITRMLINQSFQFISLGFLSTGCYFTDFYFHRSLQINVFRFSLNLITPHLNMGDPISKAFRIAQRKWLRSQSCVVILKSGSTNNFELLTSCNFISKTSRQFFSFSKVPTILPAAVPGL